MSVQITTEDFELLPERSETDIKHKLSVIVFNANNLAVNNEESFRKITGFYSESKEWERQIEFLRKTANAPDQERINARNDKAKELLTPLKEIQRISKEKSSQYQMMLEEAKKKEEQRIKEAVELIGADEMPYLPPVEKTLRGDGAIVYTRIVRKFRVVDQEKVPKKYWKVDEETIERDIKLGIAEIPGVEVYEEKITQLKTR